GGGGGGGGAGGGGGVGRTGDGEAGERQRERGGRRHRLDERAGAHRAARSMCRSTRSASMGAASTPQPLRSPRNPPNALTSSTRKRPSESSIRSTPVKTRPKWRAARTAIASVSGSRSAFS